MSVTHYIDNVAVTVEFPTFPELTTAARGGEQGSGTATVPDPTGSLDLRGWKRYRAEESACTSRPIIYTGFLKGKKIRRGGEGPRGAGRVWECEFGDLNLIAHLRVLRGSDAKRPAETHAARVNWLLAKLATFADFFVDTGYVNLSPTFNLDEADYTGRYADEVLDDIAGTLGWDWFVFWDYTAAAEALFLGLRDAAILTSTLSVSNFAGEANDTTIFSTGHSSDVEDATVDRDPDETYSGLFEKYVGGQLYKTVALTGTTFIERDAFVDSSRVGKLSTATSQVATYLANHAIEKDVVTIPVRLPKAKVNLVAAGERIAVHLEHLAFATGTSYGGAGYVYVRVARRTVSQAELDFYDVVLSCTNAPKPGAAIGGGGSGDFPHAPPSAPSIVQSSEGLSNRTFASPITAGDTLFYIGGRRHDAFVASGLTPYTIGPDGEAVEPTYDDRCAVFYKLADGTESTTLISGDQNGRGIWLEFAGAWTPDAHAEATNNLGGGPSTGAPTAGAITVAAHSLVFAVAVMGEGGGWDAGSGSIHFTPPAGFTELADGGVFDGHPSTWIGYLYTATGGSFSAAPVCTNASIAWATQIVSFTSASENNPPAAGQRFGPVSPVETPDGVITTFTLPTGFEFADRSLIVFVNRLDQTLAVTSYDGVARTFTLAFAPKVGWLIEVYAQGR